MIAFLFLLGCSLVALAQNRVSEGETTQYESIDGAVIYDYEPSTQLGDDIFGTVIADLENDAPGRCSHGGPVCMEYANGNIVAFYANTSDHNLDGWSEYAVSKDRGSTWDKYNKLPYSFEAYARDQQNTVWVQEGLVTEKGTVVAVPQPLQDWTTRGDQNQARRHQKLRRWRHLDGLRDPGR